ncbi:mdm2-binding protein-like [Scleropages formosus]|uniref:Mdm2-binding protein-like n=1 Tax=Scleropages formosus TaxID=113540 RepID=A0A0N8K2U1_SCLFO|nr:mdm2-binding protein-like [Scleropages formosus]
MPLAQSVEFLLNKDGTLPSMQVVDQSSSEWEELGVGSQRSDSEEQGPSAMDACQEVLQNQGEGDDMMDSQSQAELYEESAEGFHQLSNQLPPPGRALVDVILFAPDKEVPTLKEFLPILGSLKHMQTWHSAKISVVTEDNKGWQKMASYMSANIYDPHSFLCCIDKNELWRGNILIREKKFASELQFEGFCLKERRVDVWGSLLSSDTTRQSSTKQKPYAEVFQYFQPVLELLQVVSVSDLPVFFRSSMEFELGLTKYSTRSARLLDQLRTLQGKVGVLLSLSCTVSPLAVPPIPQLSSQKWKEFVAKRPKALSVPEADVKGETAQYLWLVQGNDSGSCTAWMIHSASQINGAAAMASINGLLKEKALASSGMDTAAWLRSLPCLYGDQLLQRERKLTKVQILVLKECLRRREEAQKSPSVPVNDLKVLLGLAREQYLKMHDNNLPRTKLLTLEERKQPTSVEQEMDTRAAVLQQWPERSVLRNLETHMKHRQTKRSSLLLAGGSSESLLGPKDVQKVTPALLDAKELLKHFTPEGQPSGELQPLLVHRGENPFHLSQDLTPRKVTQLPFSKAASSRYHGIEFCLDEQNALDRDRGFTKLQSRLIRYETQTTCSREPCPVPLTLSPAPSPAVLSEPSSVPDGETLLSETRGDPPRLKRRSRETEGLYAHKRLAKSESSESLASQCSSNNSVGVGAVGGGGRTALRALRRQQPTRSQLELAADRLALPKPEQSQCAPQVQRATDITKESRSQKHHRMLKEVVAKTLKEKGITSEHKCFEACSQRLFEISKFYLKDLKTSRGLHEEMKKAARNNSKQAVSVFPSSGDSDSQVLSAADKDSAFQPQRREAKRRDVL